MSRGAKSKSFLLSSALNNLFLTLLICVFSVSGKIFAATQTGTASATIVTPLAIAVGLNLRFGKISSSAAAGTVLISAAGIRTSTGGVGLVSSGSTQGQATFNVTGDFNSTYSIGLPASTTIVAGANSMTVNTFVSNPATTGTLSATGAQTVNVGATLNVAASQAGGSYTGTFVVTMNYN